MYLIFTGHVKISASTWKKMSALSKRVGNHSPDTLQNVPIIKHDKKMCHQTAWLSWYMSVASSIMV